jgi:MFS family permease
MQYRKIIGDSWAFTQNNKGLVMWYAFLPSVISTVYGIGYLVYQYIAFNSGKFDTHALWLKGVDIFNIIKVDPTLLSASIAALVLFAILYFFAPTFSTGAIIQIAARRRNQQQVRLHQGISYGFKRFLPLFEYHTMMHGLSFAMVLTELSFTYRHLDLEAFKLFVPIFVVIGVVVLIFGLFATYTEMFIVIDEEPVFRSVLNSAGLVVSHWQYTFLILILLMLIGLRIIFNILLVLVLPLIIIVGIGFLASLQLQVFGIVLAGLVAALGLYLAGILGGNLMVFSKAVWTFTFLELTENGEKSAREKE